MCEDNQTKVSEVFLHGFHNIYSFNIAFFSVFLVVYIVILAGNLSIITVTSISHHLQSPMYFFLKNLSITDVLFTSNLIPALLYVILKEKVCFSITGCIFQYCVHSFLAFIQSFLLTVMAYDRYVAICEPLQYSSIMTDRTCAYCVFFCWGFSYILISSELILIYQLQFCMSNDIDHFFCDIGPILEMSSSDTTVVNWVDFVICVFTIFLPFVFISGSYALIFITILRMTSINIRKKAFSTCSSHLLVVCIHYGTVITIYVVPSKDTSPNESKFKLLTYSVLTPFINPIIYSLRNQEIIEALRRLTVQHRPKK